MKNLYKGILVGTVSTLGFVSPSLANVDRAETLSVQVERSGAIQVATNPNVDSERDGMRQTLTDWEAAISEKLEDAGDAAEDASDDASAAAREAWSDLQDAWADVETATEENWDAARQSFEDAQERMEAAWGELTKE